MESEILPLKAPTMPTRQPMDRKGIASVGNKIQLLTNHFRVRHSSDIKDDFYQYTVTITAEDGTEVDSKYVGRKILDELYKTYPSDFFNGRQFAYDGNKILFTIGSLPNQKLELPVVVDEVSTNRRLESGDSSPIGGDKKRSRGSLRSRKFTVALKFAAQIPIQSIALAMRGQGSEHTQEAVRVLDVILRQNATQKGCLLVKQSFFRNEPTNFVVIGGGVVGCRGFYSSFRPVQGGLSLNVDTSTTMLVKPGQVVNFLLEHQKVDHPDRIDWIQAGKTLKNLRVKAIYSNLEHKIIGLSEETCGKQRFKMKQKNGKEDDKPETEITVSDYFLQERGISVKRSEKYPCINVGRPKRPVYIPIELCELVSLQRYTRALSSLQKASLVEKSRQKPQERRTALSEALHAINYNADPLLLSAGISVSYNFPNIEGRVISPPELTVGNNVKFVPRNGRWNFNNRTLWESKNIKNWCIVNFNARCNMDHLVQSLQRCAEMKGMTIDEPKKVLAERPEHLNEPAEKRIKAMEEQMKSELDAPPEFILCILSQRKTSNLYGPWKKKCLCDLGIPTQCIAPSKINDQYLTNVLLKINAKMGGVNSLLAMEKAHVIPLLSEVPTLIVGMDVSHGSVRSNLPSIAAVVSSRQWPLISRYRAAVRAQSAKLEMIDNLFKKVEVTKDGEVQIVDQGIFRELLMDFYCNSGSIKPMQIIIFRDGVSESQFSQVLNIELDQIMEACKFSDEDWYPKFTVVVAQKNHHTRFFQANSPDNVPPGTVIDNGICHPTNYDFYLCAHAGMIGTTRPTHYHVLYDETGFSPDDMQQFIHALSYVYQRSTTAISTVAPICYAHLAASQASHFIQLHPQPSSSQLPPVLDLPPLHANLKDSMFFC